MHRLSDVRSDPAEFMMDDLPKHSFSRTYDTSVKDMYRIIFGDDCPFSKETLVNKGTTGNLLQAIAL